MKKELPLQVIMGNSLMKRWDMSPPEIIFIMMNHDLNTVYREPFVDDWFKDGTGDMIQEYFENGHEVSKFIFWKPDVLKLEKEYECLTHGQRDVRSGLTIMKDWGLEESELYDAMQTLSLEPVDPLGTPVDLNSIEELMVRDRITTADLLFKLENIARIENEYAFEKSKPIGVKKLRPDQIAKQECRKVAKEIWEKDPTLTIKAMTDMEEIINVSKKPNGDLYSEKTVRNWIKDLCPDRSPGRRPKKLKN